LQLQPDLVSAEGISISQMQRFTRIRPRAHVYIRISFQPLVRPERLGWEDAYEENRYNRYLYGGWDFRFSVGLPSEEAKTV